MADIDQINFQIIYAFTFTLLCSGVGDVLKNVKIRIILGLESRFFVPTEEDGISNAFNFSSSTVMLSPLNSHFLPDWLPVFCLVFCAIFIVSSTLLIGSSITVSIKVFISGQKNFITYSSYGFRGRDCWRLLGCSAPWSTYSPISARSPFWQRLPSRFATSGWPSPQSFTQVTLAPALASSAENKNITFLNSFQC